ncbi:TIGR02391 family protein [Pseudonocardia xinjiangensis]|uniref:Conserved hypothetical protein CHP02391 domain-containing protein n=1 Tax=Pseudonocardia xinjiangensis TaxID=75289 RepID=A0ABX1R995_9PSEU|nr:TIGR02391 family protein [Pseudonocardia xinjiangensis]NMH76229.1 hypothetical protein [Pseudonocardia xinjiangensis]
MDRPWMIERLNAFIDLAEESLTLANPYKAERKALQRKLQESDPVIREILNAVRPGLGDYRKTATSGWSGARTAAQTAVGILKELDDLRNRLAPDSPTLPADTFHPWVWDAARTFWESRHYAQAVEQAWKSINAHLQNKVGRRDVSDDALVNAALPMTEPKAGNARLHLPGDRSSPTWVSRQRGLHMMGQACAAGIRNVVAHELDLDLPSQVALEYLAALSVLARWIDETELVTAGVGMPDNSVA